ncbi:MAG: hypothetical protein H6746_05315 [Deltaproteobacteria bacterium]|nr:hypothetical protein [Deltaproteobacteria bacterium]
MRLSPTLAAAALCVCCAGEPASSPDLPDASADLPDADVPPPEFDPLAIPVPWCAVDEAAIDARMSALSLRQQIGQHLIVGLRGDAAGPDADGRALIDTWAVGGVFLQPATGLALGAPETTAALLAQAQSQAVEATGVPLWVCIDQEGGTNAALNRLTGGTDTIGSTPIGQTRDPEVAFREFDLMGRELRALGVNLDLAPVLDTVHTTRNGNLNTRAFGPDAALNARLGQAAVVGLQRNLVVATAKHFPGDGLSSGNPHTDVVVIDTTREGGLDAHMEPFRAAIAAGTGAIMTMPALFSALDPERPAITSRIVHQQVLRQEMGFEGLIITDALGMRGASIGLDEGDLPGLEALRAGADLLLYVTVEPAQIEQLATAVEGALAAGTLSREELDASTRRILRAKARACLASEPPAGPGALSQPADAAMTRQHAARAIALVEDDGAALPLAGRRVVYVGPDTAFQDAGSGWLNLADRTMADALRDHDPAVESVLWALVPNAPALFSETMDAIAATQAQVLVIGTVQARWSLPQQQLVEWLIEAATIPVVHLTLGVPFDWIQSRGRVSAVLALGGLREPMIAAAAAVLYGDEAAGGQLLYDLSDERWSLDPGQPRPPGSDGPDRCQTRAVSCGGQGVCVDSGSVFGCVCHPNHHPSADGLDCVPDGR